MAFFASRQFLFIRSDTSQVFSNTKQDDWDPGSKNQRKFWKIESPYCEAPFRPILHGPPAGSVGSGGWGGGKGLRKHNRTSRRVSTGNQRL